MRVKWIINEEYIIMNKLIKALGDSNPITTQCYGADPYALVYNDTVYIYMTADAYEYDENGDIKENSYSKIRSIRVVSTKDFKNFEDHGEIPVAGEDGIAKWAHNSWAPAAAHKKIDGKEKFFLYFADNGGGIGVLSADSPIGPFEDPLGHGLITRSVPTCDRVAWLFDPAVLTDDDGTGYIYFGGGVPGGMFARPGTGRCAKLGADMISLDGDPVEMDTPYLFEDSGIHKFKDKYYYSYCSNFNVDEAGTKEYGFANGEICVMESDKPLGPFKFKERILENPEKYCGLGGNNHHAVFSFNNEWYIVYHSRMLEKSLNVEHGYRATSVEKFKIADDGSIGTIVQTHEGPKQLVYVDPFKDNSAVCVSEMRGAVSVPENTDKRYGKMVLNKSDSDAFICVTGVDFGSKAVSSLTVNACVPAEHKGTVRVYADDPSSSPIATIDLIGSENAYKDYKADVNEKITGVHNLIFVFEGDNVTVKSWKFA